jgi:hypothetical protein
VQTTLVAWSVGVGPHVSIELHESVKAPQPHCCVAHVSLGEQVHECELALQTPPSQPPQSSVPPHPSLPPPHTQPRVTHVLAVHPHWFAFPEPPHVCGGVHPGWHVTTLPQPSLICPHTAPFDWQVAGIHVPLPHLSGPPPPHVPASQVPQSSVPPQPSVTVPHSAPSPEHVSLWHVHWWFTSQMSLTPGQVPQSTLLPHASLPAPHPHPSCGHVCFAHESPPSAPASEPPPVEKDCPHAVTRRAATVTQESRTMRSL